SRSTLAFMICPFWQNPHCGTCSSIQARWTGCSTPFFARPSSVVISPLTLDVGVTHDRTATPLMMTVQAPHWPSPQPKCGPCTPTSFRRMYSSGVNGSTSTVCLPPFTVSVILLMLGTPGRPAKAGRYVRTLPRGHRVFEQTREILRTCGTRRELRHAVLRNRAFDKRGNVR